MVTIGMNYRVIPGKEQIFESAFEKVLKAMDGMDGHDSSHLFKEVGNESHYLIASDWSSQENFMAFIHSDSFKKVTDWGKDQILAGRPSHQVYKH